MPEFRILGPLEATHSGQPLTPTPPKIRSVLALLLLRANRIVSVESLIEELWGPEPPRSAVTTVQTYIYHLRRLFGVQPDEHDRAIRRPQRLVRLLRCPRALEREDGGDAARGEIFGSCQGDLFGVIA